MAHVIATVLGDLAILVGVFAVHELGHYLAGAVAGIPSTDRRIVLLSVPPHVALADGSGWASPFENERFGRAYRRYDPARRYAILFTAGGLGAQTAVAVVAGIAIGPVAPELGHDVVRVSLWFLLGLVVVDLLATARRGRPFSDVTHLWRLDPPHAVAILAVAVGIHLAALGWLA